MYPTTNVLYRVFTLRVLHEGKVVSGGTMFAIDVGDRQYFVTARHIAQEIGIDGIQVMSNDAWVSYPTTLVGHGKGEVDVSVITLSDALIPDESRFPLPTGSKGAILGQEMMFLGFPGVYDPSMGFSLHHGYPMPLVKYARLSSLPTTDHPMWLDGHNNRGFSGSPLCFSPGKANELFVAGVVSAYQPSVEPVIFPGGKETGLYLRENTGLMHAWDIRHCLDLINLNPVGFEIQ